MKDVEESRVGDPDPVRPGPFCLDPELDPENFHRIRIRILSVWYFGNVKLYKQGKNILKIEIFTHF